MLPLSIFLFALLYLGYRFYASYLGKLYSVKSGETVPSVEMRDNIDYVPTNKFVLLGHHFSSIAGAGPVVGPIIAAMAFGWLPAVIWIIIGSIFIGGLHDYSSLIISVRHKGKSIAEVANQYINKRTYRIFLIFIWLALIYVVAVFADLTAVTFSNEPAVAEVSTIYLIVAVVFGFLMVKFRGKLATLTTGALLTLLLFSVLSFKYQFLSLDKSSWVLILFIYCFAASILPVNLLLQPRDYLSSYLLYFLVLIGLVGLMFGRYPITYPAFISFSSESLGGLFPFLFITIACGAVSGFHALVASGTTSKQIDDINNGKFVGYGAISRRRRGDHLHRDSDDACPRGSGAQGRPGKHLRQRAWKVLRSRGDRPADGEDLRIPCHIGVHADDPRHRNEDSQVRPSGDPRQGPGRLDSQDLRHRGFPRSPAGPDEPENARRRGERHSVLEDDLAAFRDNESASRRTCADDHIPLGRQERRPEQGHNTRARSVHARHHRDRTGPEPHQLHISRQFHRRLLHSAAAARPLPRRRRGSAPGDNPRPSS